MQIRFNAEIPFSDVLNPQSADTHRQEPGSKLVRRIQFLFIYIFYNVIVMLDYTDLSLIAPLTDMILKNYEDQ